MADPDFDMMLGANDDSDEEEGVAEDTPDAAGGSSAGREDAGCALTWSLTQPCYSKHVAGRSYDASARRAVFDTCSEPAPPASTELRRRLVRRLLNINTDAWVPV